MKIANILALIATTSFVDQSTEVNAFTPIASNLRSTTVHKKDVSVIGGRSAITPLKAKKKTKKIKRDWTFTDDNGDEYEATGDMKVKVFLPEEGSVKGCVFFMHGFSQYTKAYQETLEKLSEKSNVAVVSVDTGILSWIVVGQLFSNPFAFIRDRTRLQFVLQRALSQDTKQCIDMISKGDQEFKEYSIGKNLPQGICGHSMGGGLSFPVAADSSKVNYVFTMAPLAGVPEFDSITRGVEKRTVNNSMLLAGSCDLLAKANKVEEIAEASNGKKKSSSTFVNIDRGLHTGFEDRLVIANISIESILGRFLDLGYLSESILFRVLNFLRTNTGQLEGSEELMIFFFNKMTKGQKVTSKAADEFLKENIKPEWYEKFNFN